MNQGLSTKHILPLLIIAFSSFSIFGQGIDFFEGTWEEALKKAEEEDKIIFVDAYAVWCGPCKRMSKNVFTNEEVGKFYNKNFINVKMDMERGEGPTFGKKYPVQAYPTLYYIDFDGEVVLKARGARKVEGFIDLGNQALGRIDRSEEYAKLYEAGDRSPELIYNYVQALNRSGKSSLKISNAYLNEQTDLTTEQNLKFILEATTIADSKIFDLLIENRKAIEALTSTEEVEARILDACEGTVDRAIQFQSEDLLNTAIEKMKRHYSDQAGTFELEEQMRYAIELNLVENYLEAGKKYAKKEAKNDPKALEDIAVTIAKHFRSNQKAMTEAEILAKSAAKKSNTYSYYLTYAQILKWNGKNQEAVEAAQQSLALAANENQSVKAKIQAIIDRFQQS